ncbi:MAG: hypothetical protein K2X43_09695 [Hyphomonadaceae bacterium]|jgi:hypothetical protein|nr:hypothetical protein [Hyphomonadaceae bacterium]
MSWSHLASTLAFLVPHDKAELGKFYFFIIALCLSINIIWDICTSKTPRFHLDRLSEKVITVVAATTIASSLLVCMAVVDPKVYTLIGDFTLTLVLAGVAGLLVSIPEIDPVPGYQRAQWRRTSLRESIQSHGQPAQGEERG